MNLNEEKLEFPKIKQKIKQYAHTEIARMRIDALTSLEESELSSDLHELEETLLYISSYSPLGLINMKNLMPDLALLNKEGVSSIEFFYEISLMLNNIKEIKRAMIQDEKFSSLINYVNSLKPLENLASRIDSIISKDMSIYDNASSNLASIRFQIRKEESGQSKIIHSLTSKYSNYLNDERPALKNQGLTLPVKSTYKNRVEGVVVDISSSGNTAFILPMEILISNNKIELLKAQEKDEIALLLKELAKYCLGSIDDLRKNLFTLATLDFLFSKALYAQEIHASVAKISSSCLKIYDGRHPLLMQDKVIPNSFVLDKERIMLITGPNAGGKTVALKTVGILVLMHQAGLAIPAKEAEIPYFENIYVDIGDNQSLDDNLSTFTGHMRALKSALDGVSDRCLVLIDELGTGTSPFDGEALGIGVINYLHNKNAYAILSSHYDGLKSYALENPYIMNASMIFNEEKLSPTYKIRLGVAGKSYGLEVATREGLPELVISKAKEYIEEKKNSDREMALEQLNQRLMEVDALRKSLEEKNIEILKLVEAQNKELEAIKAEKRKLEESLEEEKEEMLLKTKREIESMMEKFKQNKDVKMHQVIEAKRKIDDILYDSEEEEDNISQEEYQVNDYVILTENGLKGTIKSISKDMATILTDKGLTLKVKLSALKHHKKEVSKVKKTMVSSFSSLQKMVPLECNVIGLHVAEALEVVEKYLDDARSVRYHIVRIIHGSGTGKLRSAIQEYLKKQTFVESFRFGGGNEGGVGATVVTLK